MHIEHVQEIRVAPGIELVGPFQLYAALFEQFGQHAMCDRGPQLGFDVVADQRQPGLFESSRPLRVAGDEYGNVVHKSGPGAEGAFGIKPGRLLGTHWQIIHDDFGSRLTERLHDVLHGGFGFIRQ